MIGAVHTDYFEAGAGCVITASCQATYESFMKCGLSEGQAGELIQLSITIATVARDLFWANYANRTKRLKTHGLQHPWALVVRIWPMGLSTGGIIC